MNNSKKMTEIIEKKKELSQEKTPKYGTRKLSIGLVSCMLGFSLIIAPGSSKAAEASENETVATETNTPEENPVEEATPVANEEIKAEETKEADTFVEKLETIEVEEGEEIDYKEAVTNLPQDAKLDVITPVDTKEAGEKTTSVKITFADGSEKEIQIKVNVKAVEEDAENLEISELKDNEAQTASPSEKKLPANRTDKPNWEEKEQKGDDYWELGKTDKLENQRLVRVTTSDPIEIVDTTYQGYFSDANGRTNLRLVYMEKSAAISAVWKKAEFNFGKLVDKIDFDKSYGVDKNGKRYTFSTTNNPGIYTLNVAEMISARTQNKNNLPINLVLKDGVTLESLGQEDYKIQMRLVDANGERIYAFAPGKAALDYSTYTRTTSVSLKNKMNSEFLRGPEQQKGDILAVQRSFMSEFIANPAEYNDTTELGVLRTQYQSETGAIPGNTTDGKPHGFMQMFDADMVKYLKPDAAGFIAYTQLLDATRKDIKSAKRVGFKLSDLNYTADGKLAYFIIGEANFQKDGVKVVRVDSMKNSVYVTGIHFTAIDYVVDKKQFIETFEATGKNKVDFSIMTGWIESNPKGWTIYEEEFDHDYVVPEGDTFTVDLGEDPEGSQIMIQVGDEVHAFVRTQQGYYAGYKAGRNGIEKIERIGKGLYEITLREGATIKKGDKVRILLPDSPDHNGTVSFLERKNGSEYNQGAAQLKLQGDRNINMHLYRKDKGSFKVYYTLKGETEQKVLEFTKGVLWNYKDTDKILDGIPNRATDPSGGNFWINTQKLQPGTNIIVEAYNEKGEKEEEHTSYYLYDTIDKANEKYTKMAWVDHSDVLAGISIQKSLFTPYQEIFTNDYTGDQQKDFYENPRQNPTKTDDFMKNTEELLGFTKYDGGKIRMRYIDPSGVIYISKADADANEYNDKGDITKDYTKKITVNGKEYVASPYRLNLKDFSQLKENRDAGYVNPDGSMTLVKDMRLIINASDGSSIPSDWLEVRVKTRVLFDATDGAFDNGTKQSVKVVPDNVKFFGDEGYAPNGFTGANVKAGTGDEFVAKPTAEGKTFLGWATAEGKAKLGKTIVKAEDYNNLDASMKFTSETTVTTHQVVYAIWSEETLITFDANGGKFDDDSTTKTDDIKDGVQAPKNPTQDGKEFLGWASTPDATEAEAGILDNVTEAKTVYAVWKDAETQKIAEKVQPEYTEADAQVGKPTTITAPNFKDDKGQDTTKPDGTKFDLGKDAPEGATINPETGEITYTPTEADAGKPVEIPVVVTYKDGSTDEVNANVTVAKAAEDKTVAPTVEKPKAGDKEIKGTAPAGSDVTVTLPDGTEIKTKADDQGNWTAEVPADKELSENDEIKVVAKDGDKKPSDEATATVGKADDKGTKVGGDVKPVKPTDDKQDTGIKVENPDDDTKVTAKDEDGKDVPVEIDKDGNVIVTPGTNVDGPITVTIEDPDLPGGKVEIEVPVVGHEKGKDDNNSDKDDNKTIADKTNPTVPSKTEVKDKNNLTDEEKDKVKKAIEDANKDKFPQGTKVEIGKDGTATITYPDGSVDIIKGNDLVNQKANAGASGSINRVNSSNTGKNVKTGVGSSATILATLATAVSGLFASKKRKND
ncbi:MULTISPECIES: Rib/alpha-like domain-containing protein [Anaerococcus]|uniref:Rib/alpha-like domain-containing protein n=1 Tax=Anaerococcus TaxID=165779 RepID=UPI00242FC527|nr:MULTISPECIES: Rib/alpha-like domain-containing protein [Anaerococcus]MDD7766436.1 Rib/alpha-like domain-containing protein [Anaerococcus vaginalis]MDY6127070.1 Rib/alpha-like domain-containing protein [Anaerococcus sp.]